MPQPAGNRKVSDVVSWVTDQFGDTASVQIDSNKIIRYINMANLEITSRDPKAYQGVFSLDTTVGVGEYPYPPQLIQVSMVKWGNTPLQPIAFEQIQSQVTDEFTNTKGDCAFWSHWANNFQLWPVPQKVATLTVYGTAKPPDVTGTGDTLPLSDLFFPRICEYVMSKAQELDEDFEASAASRTLFEDQLKLGQNREDQMVGTYPLMNDPDSWYWDV